MSEGCSADGETRTFIFVFDNTYSTFRSKTCVYQIRITDGVDLYKETNLPETIQFSDFCDDDSSPDFTPPSTTPHESGDPQHLIGIISTAHSDISTKNGTQDLETLSTRSGQSDDEIMPEDRNENEAPALRVGLFPHRPATAEHAEKDKEEEEEDLNKNKKRPSMVRLTPKSVSSGGGEDATEAGRLVPMSANVVPVDLVPLSSSKTVLAANYNNSIESNDELRESERVAPYNLDISDFNDEDEDS